MKKSINVLDKKTLYSGFFKLHQYTFKHKKHNGSWTKKLIREVFSGAHVVTVLPYDSKAKKIVLIDQFRSGLIEKNHGPLIKEIVAGYIDKGEKQDELPNDILRRLSALEDEKPSNFLLDILNEEILETEQEVIDDTIKKKKSKKGSESERVRSIISFPMLLLHTLRIYQFREIKDITADDSATFWVINSIACS